MSELPTPANIHPIHILMVDDDNDDVELTRMSLQRDRVLNHLDSVADGVEAMEYLRQEGEFTDAKRPDLILLDLNMPRKDGREVLQEIKGDPELAAIPVVVFTSSDHDKDIIASYKYQANSYVTKPVDLAKFREILNGISSYWFCTVKLPTSSDVELRHATARC